jgi:molybdopterin synthase catalytic subunit
LADLQATLAVRAPSLRRLPLAFAVNRQYAPTERVLADGDEVALIPPISGGAGDPVAARIDLVAGALDPRALEAECRTDADGAIATFHGTTRNHNQGAAVLSLHYEAYAEMVDSVMAAIFAAARERFAITRIRVAHRLGDVPVGATSVVVVVSAPHRGPAFDACRYVMDRLKHEAPIWKRELLRDDAGERWIGELPRPAD